MTASIRKASAKSAKMRALTIVLSVMFISFILGSVIVKGQSTKSASSDNTYFTNITVDKGDTLWSIASQYIDYDYYDNIYEYMEQLRTLNNITSDNVYAGDNLIVIRYSDDSDN